MTDASASAAADFQRAAVGFAGRRVLVVGDVMLDRTITGTVDRLSPEAPIPVLRHRSDHAGLGGAANVARQLNAYGADVQLVGVIGDDEDGASVADHCQVLGIDARLVIDPTRPTTRKTRFVAHRQLLRVDHETTAPVGPPVEAAILSALSAVDAPEVVVVTDHDKGMLTVAVAAAVADSGRRWDVPVLVDPKTSLVAGGCGASVVKANQWEWEALAGIPLSGDPLELVRSHSASVFASTGCTGLVVTLGGEGMVVADGPDRVMHLSALPVSPIEVSGAGDTVIASLALCLASGLDLVDAARIANHAAGLAVGQPGVAIVGLDQLTRSLATTSVLSSAPDRTVCSPEELIERVTLWRAASRQIVFTNGCFDLLHTGHLALLEAAAAEGDTLIVGVDTDASVRRNKGATRPIVPAEDRAELVAALGVVDAVVLFSSEELQELVKLVGPDVLVKGADYQIEEIVGAHEVLANGGRVVRVPLKRGTSTTRVVESIRSGPAKDR